jgi:hypothetical protein
MIDLKTLSLIDDRLRAIFPASSDQPFGDLNVLLRGAINGHQLYQAFNRTLRLTRIMRQQGEDDTSIRFRVALGELRRLGHL